MKAHELASHIPVSSLPEHLSGTSQYSHVAWIQSCVNMQTNTVQGDMQEHDTHDCVGSLLRSYSLDNSNTSIGATLSHTHVNAQLGSERAVAYANCYGDNNANPHNHFDAVEVRTQGPGQYQQSSNSGADKSQGNHQHWNGSAVSAANTSISGPNINGRGCQAPSHSDTPPDTPLAHKDSGGAADGDATHSANRPQDETVKEEDEESKEEEGVPPLPQKSLPRPLNQPSSQSPPLSSSWGLDDENHYTEVSVHMPDQGGMMVHELVEYVKRKKKKGIYQEYEEIRKEPPAGTFDYSK